ncbi:hypothetical protein BC938DRAFT_474164 [Jimgerdemannia flammicorona]|uniref:Uncharacterized protein n=1 Tax=Jimgerdemannia flammicorona TaxID=994334 RepID=A0A433QST6_9FUNG|nr:hypothetical protein BC938DRAFT_474164 [Jimgerdemannia flammicorona]
MEPHIPAQYNSFKIEGPNFVKLEVSKFFRTVQCSQWHDIFLFCRLRQQNCSVLVPNLEHIAYKLSLTRIKHCKAIGKPVKAYVNQLIAWSDTVPHLFVDACRRLDGDKKRRSWEAELQELTQTVQFKRARNHAMAGERAEDLITGHLYNPENSPTPQSSIKQVTITSENDDDDNLNESDYDDYSDESDYDDYSDESDDDSEPSELNIGDDLKEDEGNLGLAPIFRKILLDKHTKHPDKMASLNDMFDFEDKALTDSLVNLLPRTDRESLLESLQIQKDYEIPNEVLQYQKQLHNAKSIREMRQAQRKKIISPEEFDPTLHADLFYLEETYSNIISYFEAPVNILNDPSQNERSIAPKIIIPIIDRLFRMHSDLLTTYWLEKLPASTKDDPDVEQRTKLVDGLILCPLSTHRHDAMVMEFSGGFIKKSNAKAWMIVQSSCGA